MPYSDPDKNREYMRAYRKRRMRDDPVYAAKQRGYTAAYIKRKLATDPAFKERFYAGARRRHAARKDIVKAQRVAWKAAAPGPYKVSELRKDAKERRLEWSLPDALALDLVTDNCFYCGAAPTPVNGIDRVVNEKGYAEDNVVTACRHCNTAKLDRSLSDFASWIRQAAAHVDRYAIA